MKQIHFILLIIALSGCVNMSEVMESWEGHHVSDLVASWGPPQRVMDDGAGGKILVYTESRQWVTPGKATTTAYSSGSTYGNLNLYDNWGTYSSHGTGYTNATTTYTPPKINGYEAWRMFFVSQEGRIYRWQWKGL
jgi:hypothetical protein